MNVRLAELYRESQREFVAILSELWKNRNPTDNGGTMSAAYNLYVDEDMARRIRDALGIAVEEEERT